MHEEMNEQGSRAPKVIIIILLFIAVIFAIIVTLAVREVLILINAHRAKKEKTDKID